MFSALYRFNYDLKILRNNFNDLLKKDKSASNLSWISAFGGNNKVKNDDVWLVDFKIFDDKHPNLINYCLDKGMFLHFR